MYHQEIDHKRKEMLSYSEWQWLDRDQQSTQRKRIDTALSLLERDAFRSGYDTVSRIEGEFAKIMARYSQDDLSISDETVSAVRAARNNMPKIITPLTEPDNKPGRVEVAFIELLRLVAETYWEDGARRAREE